ncbi:hypothetical protein CEXT_608871 [Caerostris extrusa]|uniref:Uncharacterized protein n=1 Tax=Caerostris extrusa TaxID=172846 RepID=A0AAV4XHH7_CAEEX|nr:hypothetical protein CEXT_608871 [Caerostris extrusa]
MLRGKRSPRGLASRNPFRRDHPSLLIIMGGHLLHLLCHGKVRQVLTRESVRKRARSFDTNALDGGTLPPLLISLECSCSTVVVFVAWIIELSFDGLEGKRILTFNEMLFSPVVNLFFCPFYWKRVEIIIKNDIFIMILNPK